MAIGCKNRRVKATIYNAQLTHTKLLHKKELYSAAISTWGVAAVAISFIRTQMLHLPTSMHGHERCGVCK